MKTFSYVAKDPKGNTKKGVLEAQDSSDLIGKLTEMDLFCVTYGEIAGKGRKDSVYKFKTKELAFDCRQLAAMMSSGLTIVKALDILYKEQEKKAAKEAWMEIYEDVQKGSTFTSCLEAKRGAFPDFFISMVAAGESSGTLDVTMQRLSDHYANENKTNNKIKGAMTYPIILGVMCLVIVVGMFTLILPTFAGMMDEKDMTPLSKALMSFSNFMIKKWYILIIGIVVIILAIVYCLKVDSIRLKFDYAKIKMPLVGKLMVKIYTSRFANTMSSLYSSGIPMVECLERSSRILSNMYVDQCFEQVVDEVKQGQPLSAAIQKTEIFESIFCSIIFVGEESGALDEILAKTADYYQEEADHAITSLVGMMEPLMIIIMGCAIGLCLAGIFPMLYGGLAGVAST